MGRFGAHWHNHRDRLIRNWHRAVGVGDLVVLPGDLTFARGRGVEDDLAEIHRLKGQKVVVMGNHDHWAQGVTQTKLKALLEPYPSIHMLNYEKPYYETGDHIIVGYKGSEPPETRRFASSHHAKTLEHARNLVQKVEPLLVSTSKVIVATHYAPSQKERDVLSPLIPLLWVHGHSHLNGDDEELVRGWMRDRQAPEQLCVSSDYVSMMPVEITDGIVQPN